jgi:Uma2 family endonuclease
MPMTEELYRQVVLADPEGRWEMHRGRLREKPPMSAEHGHVLDELAASLYAQIDRRRFRIRIDHGRLARTDESHYIPDLYVIEADRVSAARRRADPLETYRDPLPLVVEIWSPSTGVYDVDEKIPEYQRRGDLEIWCFHPIERTLRGWRRQPDGSCQEFVQAHGTVKPIALPDVTIDLDMLFGDDE